LLTRNVVRVPVGRQREWSDRLDLILVNPSAGAGRAGRAVSSLRDFILKNDWEVELVVTADAADLAQQARAAATRGHKRILVLGGDGTFRVLLNALHDHRDVILGVIPAGGGNDLASALGIPLDTIQAAALCKTGEPRLIDAVRVRTAAGEERFYAGGGGLGLDAEAAFLAATFFRNWKGRFRYIAAALRAFQRFVPLDVRVTMYSQDWEGPRVLEQNVLLLGILNTPSYGGGLRVTPHAKLDDGSLDLVAVAHLNAPEVVALLPVLMLSGNLRTRRVQRFSIQRAQIESNRPAQFHGDGEILGMTPLEVEVLPRFIRILAPKKAAGRTQ
jgi:diacylglycerol kinase (ATP)